MLQERRLYRRVAVSLDVLWEGKSAGTLAEIADISPAGCFVNTAFRVREGEEVTLDLLLPRGRLIRLSGVVAHERLPAGFGIRFTGFGSDEDYGELLALVR